MKTLSHRKQAGFTLIELLLVLVMLGLAIGSMYSLYISHQRSAYVQDEVVEVQQNLRIAIGSMTRDIRMAGFLIPLTSTPVADAKNGTGAANSDIITINTAAASGTCARINEDQAGLGTFKVDVAESADAFSAGDKVRIIRPQDRLEPGGSSNTFKVSATNRDAVPPTITLELYTGADTGANYISGDIILKTSAAIPNTVTYCLGPVSGGCGDGVTCPAGQCLMRVDEGGKANAIASNLTDLQFRYLMDDNTEIDEPAAADRGKVRAVRVTITGQTQSTKVLSGGQAKTRQVESIIQLRNR